MGTPGRRGLRLSVGVAAGIVAVLVSSCTRVVDDARPVAADDAGLPDDVQAVYDIVIDGLDVGAVVAAMRVGVRAACAPGVVQISAGNYGGKLGQYPLHLHKIVEA